MFCTTLPFPPVGHGTVLGVVVGDVGIVTGCCEKVMSKLPEAIVVLSAVMTRCFAVPLALGAVVERAWATASTTGTATATSITTDARRATVRRRGGRGLRLRSVTSSKVTGLIPPWMSERMSSDRSAMVGYLQCGPELGQAPFQMGGNGGRGEAGEVRYLAGRPLEAVDENDGDPLALG